MSQRAWTDVMRRQPRLAGLPMLDSSLVAWMASRSPPGQPGGQPVLVAREREDAAAVGRLPIGHAQLVGDREAAYRRRVAAPADRDLELLDDLAVVAHVEHPPREVRVHGPWHAVEPCAARRQPGELAVVELRRLHGDPVAAAEHHSEHPARAPFGSLGEVDPRAPSGLPVEGRGLGEQRGRVAGDRLGLRGEWGLERSAELGNEVPRAVAGVTEGFAPPSSPHSDDPTSAAAPPIRAATKLARMTR